MIKTRYKVCIGQNVKLGGGLPVVIQSMTNTNTSDIKSTVEQIYSLYKSGSEIVRLTVDDDAAAKAIPYIKENLLKLDCNVPLVGCFHYNGHYLLTQYPECAAILDKYRINPGNVGFGNKHDKNFAKIIEIAIKNSCNYVSYKGDNSVFSTTIDGNLKNFKTIRIGVNWGSIDKEVLNKLIDDNLNKLDPLPYNEIVRNAAITSVLESAKQAEHYGLRPDQIVISCKVSRVQDLISVYRTLQNKCKYPLHLGLTEAGIGTSAMVGTVAALSILLNEGIGDTIRASIGVTADSNREDEVKLCREILQALEIRNYSPRITSCPGCGRASNNYFQDLTQKIKSYVDENMYEWRQKYRDIEDLKVAVMACIVNGPGESKHADIGIKFTRKRRKSYCTSIY